jgi:UDP-N-acetylglucosamine 1-carboxyvinyltransferase
VADLIVNGGKPLSGTITPSGNKNSVLPIFCATLLTDEPVTLKNVPDITDLDKLVTFFRSQGSKIDWNRDSGVMHIDHSTFRSTLVDDELPQNMRSTVLLYPALLHRLRKISIQANTKGCSLGVREIDPHLEILRSLGAVIHHGDPLVIALTNGFVGARHWLDYMSVTVTENFAMAAALAAVTRERDAAVAEVAALRAQLTQLTARAEAAEAAAAKRTAEVREESFCLRTTSPYPPLGEGGVDAFVFTPLPNLSLPPSTPPLIPLEDPASFPSSATE